MHNRPIITLSSAIIGDYTDEHARSISFAVVGGGTGGGVKMKSSHCPTMKNVRDSSFLKKI